MGLERGSLSLVRIIEELLERKSSCLGRPPLWSSGQSSWLQIQRIRVRFPALPDFLRNSGSGTGSTQPLSTTEELFEWKSSGSGSRKPRLTAIRNRCADHATPSIRKFGTNFAYKRRSLGRYSSLAG
jgi:hypothetical protein